MGDRPAQQQTLMTVDGGGRANSLLFISSRGEDKVASGQGELESRAT